MPGVDGAISTGLQTGEILTSDASSAVLNQFLPEDSPIRKLTETYSTVKDALGAASSLGIAIPEGLASELSAAGIGNFGEAGTWAGPGPAGATSSLAAWGSGALSGIASYLQNKDIPLALSTGILSGLGYAVAGPLGGIAGSYLGGAFADDAPDVQTVVPHSSIKMDTPLQGNLNWGFSGDEFTSDNYGSWGGIYNKGSLSYKDNTEENFMKVMEQTIKDSPDVMRAMNDLNSWDMGFYGEYFGEGGALAGGDLNSYSGRPKELDILEIYVRNEDPTGDFMKYRYGDGMSYEDSINKVFSNRWEAIKRSGWDVFKDADLSDPGYFMSVPGSTWQENSSGPQLEYYPGGQWAQGGAGDIPTLNINDQVPDLIEMVTKGGYTHIADEVEKLNIDNEAFSGLTATEMAFLDANPEMIKTLWG